MYRITAAEAVFSTGSLVGLLPFLVIGGGIILGLLAMPSTRAYFAATHSWFREYFYGDRDESAQDDPGMVPVVSALGPGKKSPEEVAAQLDFSLDEFSKRFTPPGPTP